MRSLILSILGVALAAVLGVVAAPADAISTRQFLIDDAASFSAGDMRGTAVLSSGAVTLGVELRRIELPNVPVAYTVVQDGRGTTYVGTGHEGKIYKVSGDQLTEFAATGQLLVASLAIDAAGTVYAGTLPEGRIYAISSAGQMREFARPEGTEHVWSLVWDEDHHVLYAGTGPAGKIFSIDVQGRVTEYYDAEASHIMSLDLDADGALYAGTSDDALLLRLRGPGRADVVHDFPGNEITAIDARDGALAVAANEFTEAPAAAGGSSAATKAAAPRPKAGKGRLWLVHHGRAEQVYSSDEGHFSAVELAEDGTIYAASGKDGHVFRVNPDRTSATWIDVDERQVLDINLLGPTPVLVTGDTGALYRVATGEPQEATWTSKVLDAEFLARFGELSWRATGPLELQTRSGNTQEPDGTWSEWSQGMTTNGPVRSPAARFLQVRARFTRSSPVLLHAVTVFYLPANQRAVVQNIVFAPDATKNADPPAPNPQRKLTWQIQNPDSDRMRYRLRYRGEGQATWRRMHVDTDRITETEYTWDTSGVPDGYYFVEVEASDEFANPQAFVLRSSAQSEPLLVDNHDPAIEGLAEQGGSIRGRATDSVGPISKLEYAIDGGEWFLVFPEDGLFDTASETFVISLREQAAGSHIVAVRATDAGGNRVTAEIVTR